MTTKAEAEWMEAITDLGCIVCLIHEHAPRTPGAVHHLKSGGRRIDHRHSICLCDPGHHQNAPKDSGKVSRHPNKARFEAAYGTEEWLYAKTSELVAERAERLKWPGIDIDRIHRIRGAVRQR